MTDKKMILLGLGNDGFRYHYTIKKNESIKQPLIKFLNCLGFEKETPYLFENKAKSTEIELKVAEYSDWCIYYKNKEFDMDIFFGHKTVNILIRTKRRTKLINAVEQFMEIIKIKPVKRMKNRKEYKKLARSNKKHEEKSKK